MNIGSFGLSIGFFPTGEQKGVFVEKLAAKWMINLYAANAMLGSNTKLVIRSSDNPSISRRLKTNDCMLQYNYITTDVFIDTVMIVGG